jgi:NADH-quinone oxidoreductase subunit A
MTTDYLPIVVMLILATLFAGLSFAASILMAPKRPTSAKLAPYECGIVPEHEPAERFPVKFYLVAMVFIIFDIELVFLYPWAVIFRRLEIFGLIEMGLFLVSVVIAYGFVLSSGALDWGPLKRVAARVVEPVRRASGMPGQTPRPVSRSGSDDQAA